ncbi:OLC1v1007665C1 [Oldenlandia corymbosa var. corymbosa]|uniref:OLC1v1007665C1 n=1 Tax=Oldenlandia corymbosa var. corymbosa TaxID=529605 RepID=A0AAV1DMZ5_OLDCO|nr:OLC1v1007665C1 [Oldenlandia corymbosa var. corymbosa]
MDEHYSPLQNQLDDDEELGRHMDGFFGDPAHAPPPSSLDVFLLIVTWGQDISARLMDLAHSNQTSIYVLSALGGLSWVGLILDSIAGNTAIYEGPLHIFSLTVYVRASLCGVMTNPETRVKKGTEETMEATMAKEVLAETMKGLPATRTTMAKEQLAETMEGLPGTMVMVHLKANLYVENDYELGKPILLSDFDRVSCRLEDSGFFEFEVKSKNDQFAIAILIPSGCFARFVVHQLTVEAMEDIIARVRAVVVDQHPTFATVSMVLGNVLAPVLFHGNNLTIVLVGGQDYTLLRLGLSYLNHRRIGLPMVIMRGNQSNAMYTGALHQNGVLTASGIVLVEVALWFP